jgi:hypothetical protein
MERPQPLQQARFSEHYVKLYGLIDEFLKAINHNEYKHLKKKLSDAEILFAWFVACTDYQGNYELACFRLAETGYLSHAIDPGRFTRRLEKLVPTALQINQLLVAYKKKQPESTLSIHYLSRCAKMLVSNELGLIKPNKEPGAKTPVKK